MSIEAHWYRDSLVSRLLLPLSWIFCALAALRRLGYRRGWFAVVRLPVPVIVVGNISVGGSGKTPFLIWLVQWLAAQGYRVGVVSRGYGGNSTTWPRLVEATSAAREVGDEPVVIRARTGCPVAVAPDRVAAARLLLAHHALDLIVADDGMQHYRLGRDLEIAIVDQARGLGNGRCLPAGPLRERPARLRQVDCVVHHGAGGEMELAGETLVRVRDGQQEPLAAWSGRAVHAVAGIGHPARFFEALRRAGLQPVEHPFADHYAFTASDLAFADGRPVIMTEKDAVKCRGFAAGDLWYLPVTARVARAVGEAIRNKLRGNHG